GGEAKRHAKRTVWAREFPVWATENPVTLSVSPQMLIGRSLGRGVFRAFSKENSEDLTNKRGKTRNPPQTDKNQRRHACVISDGGEAGGFRGHSRG
ncbi:MAG: hypothetical protein MR037_04910, partial [Bacteroidales bacterium]|nr:hypothetical protein [Bacteroidales bacterium]